MNKRSLVILLLSMTLLGVSGTDIYISALPQMIVDFHTTQAMVNATILMFNLGMALSVLFTGVLSNRFGRRKIIILGVVTFSMASFLIILAPTITLLLGLRFIQGIGCGGIIIVQRLILRDIMNESEQVKAGGILVLGSIISPALAPVIGAFLAQIWDWHFCFLFSGILGSLIAIVSLILIQETNSTPIAKLPNLAGYLSDYLILLRDPICINLIAIMCLTFSAYFAFLGVSSYLYILVLGLSPLMYSYIFILLAASYLVGNSYMLYLNKRGLAPSAIIRQGVSGGVVGLLVLASSLLFRQHFLILTGLTCGLMLIRVSSALIINPAQIKIVNHFREQGALALGLAICLQFGIAGLVATLVGKFTLPQLLPGFVAVSAVCLLLAAGCFAVLTRSES